MIRRIRQWLCARRGHPYRTITVPIVGEHPWDSDVETTFCRGCGSVREVTEQLEHQNDEAER